MQHYFAAFEEIDLFIAVFNTEEDRDNWVNYKDDDSILLEITPKDDYHRIALDEDAAAELTEDRIYDERYIIPDEINPNFGWVETPASDEWEVSE